MTILFITQKLHEQDAFVVLWVRAFMRRRHTVNVLCLEDRVSPKHFPIYSLGKERGTGTVMQVLHFWKFITTLRYDCVFIHMSPIWGVLGGIYWMLTRTPVYLWYTHYKRSFLVRVMQWYCKRIFCATEQSVPWLVSGVGGGYSKKVVVGHGIDLEFWKKRENVYSNPHALLVVHRLSRSKRLEIGLRALALLPDDYTMTIYGIVAESQYVTELHALVETLHLQSRVTFKGTVPMEALRDIYPQHHLIMNMASETIDKTMLEAMTCGCYPVTTQHNAEAIGLRSALQSYGRRVAFPIAPEADTPEAVVAFIQSFRGADPQDLYRIVQKRHSLERLVEHMSNLMATGK